MDLKEELKSAGVYPSGPVSAWPKERNEKLMDQPWAKGTRKRVAGKRGAMKDMSSFMSGHPIYTDGVEASPAKMAGGALRAAGQALKNGKVSKEVREERFATCKACPAFIPDSERCSKCGCFMAAKTWIGGNPDALCPLKKWDR